MMVSCFNDLFVYGDVWFGCFIFVLSRFIWCCVDCDVNWLYFGVDCYFGNYGVKVDVSMSCRFIKLVM